MLARRVFVAFAAAAVFAPACGAEIFEPAPQPEGDPAPFAESGAGVRYWPVITTHPRWREVSFQRAEGGFAGVELRRFNAPRPAARANNPTRRHVGVDLFARAGDAVVAVEDGTLLAFYPFLRARTGEMSYALLAAHAGYVANYGEVRADSLRDNRLALGDTVGAGQAIAAISDTEQLHFETYAPATVRSQSWRHGAPRPASVLDPTRLLLDLAQNGQRAAS
jgi:murein DD-endopeptidase MepM/ murein hydrolase activator NlpD